MSLSPIAFDRYLSTPTPPTNNPHGERPFFPFYRPQRLIKVAVISYVPR